ncbi:MAG: glycosyl hydrolase family 5 [Candidatus Hydrogenedentes bacterium]|nr:glycosyl hydrolase family 5 [Candidatus Hydrogenedentota bacterium]
MHEQRTRPSTTSQKGIFQNPGKRQWIIFLAIVLPVGAMLLWNNRGPEMDTPALDASDETAALDMPEPDEYEAPALTEDEPEPAAIVMLAQNTENDPASGNSLSLEVAIQADASLAVYYKEASLITSTYHFWGANWDYASANLGTIYKQDNVAILGNVPDLGLNVTGYIEQPESHVFRYAYVLDAQRPLRNITGGGIEWKLDYPSSRFPEAEEPQLLGGNRGWEWTLGEGLRIEVRFDKPVAKVFFERGRPQQIRCFFIGEEFDQGRQLIAMTAAFPKGSLRVPSLAERYGPMNTTSWRPNALDPHASPVDLSFLNHVPAGKHGFVKAKGEDLVFDDGAPARFWGGNLAAYALFASDREIEEQATRIARLGYNLMRMHHHDSMAWVDPTVIDKTRDDSRHLNKEALDRVDYWIKCLKDRGVYVWLDLHVGRTFKDGDVDTEFGRIEGFREINDGSSQRNGEVKGFAYYNPPVQELMKEFNEDYLSHVNAYTGLAYKDEPAIMGLLITNENDLTYHFGNRMLADKNNPVHNEIFEAAVREFSLSTGLDRARLRETWLPGPNKIFLNNQEHLFNKNLLGGLDKLGVKVPVATTNSWGRMGFASLPSLTDGGIIDAHSYGEPEALGTNPRYKDNFLHWIGAAQIEGMPLSIAEWNVPYPSIDRFTAPLYMASVACLQGWDAPMIYNYSQRGFEDPNRAYEWSTFIDPAITGIIPAAAIAYRQQHVQPAKKRYVLKLTSETMFDRGFAADTSPAVRTLLELSRISIGLPDVPELAWDRALPVSGDAEIITDPEHDFIPPNQTVVQSDTGELRRDWKRGVQAINTPKTQAAQGWIGGLKATLADVTIETATPKAVIAVTSLDDTPIRESHRILITAIARVVAVNNQTPFLSEPVLADVSIRAPEGLTLRALNPDGTTLKTIAAPYQDGAYFFTLDAEAGTHWLMLE